MSPVVTNADPHIHLLNRGILLKNKMAILEFPLVVTNADHHIHRLNRGHSSKKIKGLSLNTLRL